MTRIYNLLLTIALIASGFSANGQSGEISGRVTTREKQGIPSAIVSIRGLKTGTQTDSAGNYLLKNIPYGNWLIETSFLGFKTQVSEVTLKSSRANLDIVLNESPNTLNEVVVTGTMKEVSKLDSPVPVEVYTPKFFRANPTPSIFDALQIVNGVRPQVNCNVCNTGDIHINGLEGPYTMVLIDGMPIVSGLSTVYGLSGIPQALIERVEIVKGPASTLYGSEAVGGLINIITKKPSTAPDFSADVYGTGWGELNADMGVKFRAGAYAQSLLGINYYSYQNPVDKNQDNFTDLTLQSRISIFNKWSFERKNNRVFSLAGRYIYEDRWGGEMNWTRKNRGGDEIYGESIYTKRWELFGSYQLPVKERVMFSFSTNGHDQNSVYGHIPYMANQYIAFGQLTWTKKLHHHDLLTGLTYRYTYYDDNTPATATPNDRNQPSHTNLPGIFVQDEIALGPQHKLLLGMRYDYNSLHGSILTPRVNYKWNSPDKSNVVRVSAGNGYRVANVFTEDHAALTGAREVVFINDLRPETSWNGNVNFLKNIFTENKTLISFDATAFYTYFTNKIIADYDTDPNKIIYDNLAGHAVSQGVSLNIDVLLPSGLKMLAGGTLMNVFRKEGAEKTRQLFTERFTGVWNIGYTLPHTNWSIDYTGNLYGPMRLPLLSPTDPRSEFSPWWSIQNIQISKSFDNGLEIYGGIKNLLNWTPNKGNPFIIARANDPFDKNVQFDEQGKAMITADNPYGLTFDPTYVYGPNQGIRGFLGVRYHLTRPR